jgi:hypothetical protein
MTLRYQLPTQAAIFVESLYGVGDFRWPSWIDQQCCVAELFMRARDV